MPYSQYQHWFIEGCEYYPIEKGHIKTSESIACIENSTSSFSFNMFIYGNKESHLMFPHANERKLKKINDPWSQRSRQLRIMWRINTDVYLSNEIACRVLVLVAGVVRVGVREFHACQHHLALKRLLNWKQYVYTYNDRYCNTSVKLWYIML